MEGEGGAVLLGFRILETLSVDATELLDDSASCGEAQPEDDSQRGFEAGMHAFLETLGPRKPFSEVTESARACSYHSSSQGRNY